MAERVADRHGKLVDVVQPKPGSSAVDRQGTGGDAGGEADCSPTAVPNARLLAAVVAATAVAVAVGAARPSTSCTSASRSRWRRSPGPPSSGWSTLGGRQSALAESGLSGEALAPAHSFSLMSSRSPEEVVLEATLTRLTGDRPSGLRGARRRRRRRSRDARRCRADGGPPPPYGLKVLIDASRPKNKPKALNAALPHCSGAITGVFDAEDDVHPALLQRVDQCFSRTHADVVQAGDQLMNFRSSWLTVRNVLEYYFWFRSRLHFTPTRASFRWAGTPSSSARKCSGPCRDGIPSAWRRTASWA